MDWDSMKREARRSDGKQCRKAFLLGVWETFSRENVGYYIDTDRGVTSAVGVGDGFGR